jgi:hypothetical protein
MKSGSHKSGNMTGIRKTQNVATLSEHKWVMLCMCEEPEGERDKMLPSYAVKKIFTVF